MRKKYYGYKKRISFFWPLILVYVIILCVAGVKFLSFLWDYLSQYEQLKPENTVVDFINNSTSEYWTEKLKERYSQKTTEFENVESIISKLGLGNVTPDKLTYYKNVKEYSEESPAYIICYDRKSFALLKLRVDEEYGTGLKSWCVDSVELSLLDDEANCVEITVTVPHDAVVKINDVNVPKDYVVEEKIKYPGITIFEADNDAIPYRVKYKISGLFDLPKVSVFDSKGKELSQNVKGYDYSCVESINFANKAVLSVPKGYTVEINGVKAGNEYISAENLGYDILDEVKGYNGQIPNICRYVIEGLYFKPEISVFDEKGKIVPVKEINDEDHIYDFSVDGTLKETQSAYVCDFVKAYFKYVGEGGSDNLKANFEDVLGYTLYGSTADKVIRGSYIGVEWNSFFYVSFNKLEAGDFRSHGEDCFSCEVEYDADFDRWDRNEHYKGVFKLVFVKYGEKFLLSKMVNIES